jgi:hypothetical protein
LARNHEQHRPVKGETSNEQTLADRLLVGIPCVAFGLILHWALFANAEEVGATSGVVGRWLLFSSWEVVANLFLVIAFIKFFRRTEFVRRNLVSTRRKLILLSVCILFFSHSRPASSFTAQISCPP